MSFDLGFFARHKDTDRESVKRAYNALMENKAFEWKGNSEFDAFKKELFSAYPPVTKETSDEEFENSAWSCDTSVGAGYVYVSISSGKRGDGAAELITALLEKYDVVLCNPQGSKDDCIVIKPRKSFWSKLFG